MSLPRILYESRLADATPVASGTASGYAVENLTDWRPASKWQADALPATVTGDAGASASVDYWGVWGHDLFTQGATIELRKSNDNFSADDNLVDTVTPTSDDPFVRYVSTADERYWRIRITGTTVPTLAIAAMGEYLEIPKGLPQRFDPLHRSPQGRLNRSVAGNPTGRTTEYQKWRQTVQFVNVSWAWARSTWLAAWDAHLMDNPFVFSWDPTNYPAELYLVNIDGDSVTPHRSGNFADLTLTIEGLIA